MNRMFKTIRLLTATDLHQSKMHYRSLALAVKEQQPDAVALVGDFLHYGDFGKYQFASSECARLLADLPVKHLLFVRGNHEDTNWREFVNAWPFGNRPLTALYGSTYAIGPLIILGYPCKMGSEFTWCHSLPKRGNDLAADPETGLHQEFDGFAVEHGKDARMAAADGADLGIGFGAESGGTTTKQFRFCF